MKFPALLAVSFCLIACKPAEPVARLPPTPTPMPALSGVTLYSKNCATCHMEDGSGVPMMQPPLADSPVVAGDPAQLIRVVLEGPAQVLDPARESYSNTMPPFTQLTDAEVAAVLTHIRKTFGHDAPAITVEAVAAQRAKKS